MAMKMLIKDLCFTEELDRKALEAVRGGIYRTPQQILAHEITGLPATPDGLVLGYDGRLYPGNAPLPGPTL
jgi:hypothetical protein